MDVVPAHSVLACQLEVRADFWAVREACQQLRAWLAGVGLDEAALMGWELALAEAMNNAVEFTPPEAAGRPIRVELQVTPEWEEARVTDYSPGFDWPDHVELPPDDCESGRGIFLIQSLTDESRYLRGRSENCLVLRKRRTAPPGGPPAPPSGAGAEAEELRETRRTLELMTEELASSYESLAAIFRFSTELQENAPSGEFIERWMNQLLTITESDWFVLRLGDAARKELNVVAASARDWPAHAQPVALNDAATVAASAEARAAAQCNDVWFDGLAPLGPADPLRGIAGDSCGFVHPVLVNDTLVAVLSLGRRDRDRPFEAGQVSVAQTIGDFLGLQIRALQMQEQQLRSRLNTRDLEIAANIQRSLLPARLPVLPDAVLTAYYRSAREIGGDYYDALPLEGGNVLLVMADVMGKGLPAALFAFMFRSLVRARRELASEPGRFLAWLNQNLFQELDRADMFITAQLTFLDRRSGRMSVASAGHPPLLVVEATGAVSEVVSEGPPLGIVSDATFREESLPFPPGHALMFTDGLIEARNVQGELLGLDALKSALAASSRRREPGQVACQGLASLLLRHEGGMPPADDTAFLLISHH